MRPKSWVPHGRDSNLTIFPASSIIPAILTLFSPASGWRDVSNSHMIAVIKTGGKQHVVRENDVLKVEKLAGEVGAKVSFEVLLVGNEDGTGVKVGAPKVSGAKVEGKVVEQGRGPKVMIQKYKNKTRYRRLTSHRQPFTKVSIEKISG